MKVRDFPYIEALVSVQGRFTEEHGDKKYSNNKTHSTSHIIALPSEPLSLSIYADSELPATTLKHPVACFVHVNGSIVSSQIKTLPFYACVRGTDMHVSDLFTPLQFPDLETLKATEQAQNQLGRLDLRLCWAKVESIPPSDADKQHYHDWVKQQCVDSTPFAIFTFRYATRDYLEKAGIIYVSARNDADGSIVAKRSPELLKCSNTAQSVGHLHKKRKKNKRSKPTRDKGFSRQRRRLEKWAREAETEKETRYWEDEIGIYTRGGRRPDSSVPFDRAKPRVNQRQQERYLNRR